MKTIYREKRYYCGEYLDVYIFPTYRQSNGRRSRSKPTTAAQKKLNQRHREEKLVRLLHANFTPDDLEIHLTYTVQPESEEEAARNARNYIRRIQRMRKKAGLPPLKYIVVTERGGKTGRYHHHITINGGLDRDAVEAAWGLGYANSRRLQFTETGLAGLGHYIVKKPVGKKAWNASKNLIDPDPKTRDGRISGRRAEELARDTTNNAEYEKLYPGYFLAEAGAFHNDVNGGRYIVARFYRRDGKFIKPQRKTKNESEAEKMTVNEFAQDVHKNAVAHGWYDAPITFPEVAVMIHAEISEAVEEWRSGNPVIYGTCALSPENCKFSKICDNVGHPSGADTEGNCKPEGVAVELCDAVMRIMDFLAFMGVDIEAVLMAKHEYNKGREYRHGGKRA